MPVFYVLYKNGHTYPIRYQQSTNGRNAMSVTLLTLDEAVNDKKSDAHLLDVTTRLINDGENTSTVIDRLRQFYPHCDVDYEDVLGDFIMELSNNKHGLNPTVTC